MQTQISATPVSERSVAELGQEARLTVIRGAPFGIAQLRIAQLRIARLRIAHAHSVQAHSAQGRSRRWRQLVAVSSVLSVAIPLVWAGSAAPSAMAADLVRMLRMMAVLKAAIALVSLGVVWWRFAFPVLPRLAMAYAVGTSLMFGASVVLWQLAHLVVGAAAFHVGLAMVLLAAWRDMPKRKA